MKRATPMFSPTLATCSPRTCSKVSSRPVKVWPISSVTSAGAAVATCAATSAHECLEVSVARNEVGLAVDLDEHAGLRVIGYEPADDSFVGGPTGLLGQRSQTLGAEQVDGDVHVAVRLREGLLAIHHACASALAQFLDHLCLDLHG